jgi:hypothetical protein
LICAEHGLSVIENPNPSPGRDYGEWLGDKKPLSHKDILKQKVDEILPNCISFEDFLEKLKADGYAVNDKKKHVSIKAPDWGNPLRFDTIGGDYSEAAIRERLLGRRVIKVGNNSGSDTRVSLLVDIQAKIRVGKGAGYVQWLKIFNLKQAAKTLVFLQENGIDSYEDLQKKSTAATAEFYNKSGKIKTIDNRLKEIAELQKYIGQYSKSADTYAKYKSSGWSRKFYDANTADILLHRAAKKYFDSLGLTKLPTIAKLKQEYASLSAEKKSLYVGYQDLKTNYRTLQVALGNSQHILGITPNGDIHEASSEKKRSNSHEK